MIHQAEENLSSKEIEIDRNEWISKLTKSNVATLQKEKTNVSSEDQLDYTARISLPRTTRKRANTS